MFAVDLWYYFNRFVGFHSCPYMSIKTVMPFVNESKNVYYRHSCLQNSCIKMSTIPLYRNFVVTLPKFLHWNNKMTSEFKLFFTSNYAGWSYHPNRRLEVKESGTYIKMYFYYINEGYDYVHLLKYCHLYKMALSYILKLTCVLTLKKL